MRQSKLFRAFWGVVFTTILVLGVLAAWKGWWDAVWLLIGCGGIAAFVAHLAGRARR